MSKYSFERIGADGFEQMAKALLENRFRTGGALTQFGDGKDGGREATWTQPATHSMYVRPASEASDVPKEWVFQVKYHDIGLRGWEGARVAVESDIDKELGKLVDKYKVPCHKYILITNVPFTGARDVGTRDRVGGVIKRWTVRVPEIEVWDAADISRMLDSDPAVRTTYLGEILPGDVLRALFEAGNFTNDRRKSAFYAYLKSVLRSERDARTEEAGDEDRLELAEVFVDLDLQVAGESPYHSIQRLIPDLRPSNGSRMQRHDGREEGRWPASFAILIAAHRSMLLKGGPGVGKSTLTQFATLYHAARIVEPEFARRLAARLKLPDGCSVEDIDARCRLRYPLRVELRRYAQWMSDAAQQKVEPHLARYLAERISRAASGEINMDDVFSLAASNPLLLILDGLDEVPNPSTRATIFRELQIFLDRCEGESSDVQIVLSSRPQGYRGEFDGFEPIEWEACELQRSDFDDYCSRWLNERIEDNDERRDAERRIADGMRSTAVQQLATTLLQATVMLTIARLKHPIPHARHELFERYVNVIFERERNKETVRGRETELLRLHERLGYELLRKMERPSADAKAFGSEEFRKYVRDVMEDYGPGDLNGMKIREVADEIVTMAKDRLCLLAGKGEDQESVDFVIQSFREYFAARYMVNHEDANVDRVFESLTRRDHFWGNVLQFYGAVQSKAQQKAWISEIDGRWDDAPQLDRLIDAVRKRRALLRLLPECERPKNPDVDRAFQNILHPMTRWTWTEEQSTAALLRAFSPDRAFAICSGLFASHAENDSGTLYVELEILAKLAQDADESALQNRFQKALEQPQSTEVALEVAVLNDVPVDISKCPDEILDRVLGRLPWHRPARSSARLASALPDGVFLDFVLRSFQTRDLCARRLEIGPDAWVGPIVNFAEPDSPIHDLHGIGIRLQPFAIDRARIPPPERAALSRLETSGAHFGPYFAAIVRALLEPTDASLDATARDLETQLGARVRTELSSEIILGPRPDCFDSLHAWIGFRKRLWSIAAEVIGDDLGAAVSFEDNSWTLLLFDPRDWSELAGAIAPQTVARLQQARIAELLTLVPRPATPFSVKFMSTNDCVCPVYEVCLAAVRVMAKRGAGVMRDNANLLWVLKESRFDPITEKMARDILKPLERIDAVDRGWLAVILQLCASAAGVDPDDIRTLWRKGRGTRLEKLGSDCAVVDAKLIEDLLSHQDRESVILAGWLTRSIADSSPLFDVRERVVSVLCRLALDVHVPESDRSKCIDMLLDHPPHIDELAVWRDPGVVQLLHSRSGWNLNRLFNRVTGFAQPTICQLDPAKLRNTLEDVVGNRKAYPYEIPRGALASLIKMQDSVIPPLEDADWQVR